MAWPVPTAALCIQGAKTSLSGAVQVLSPENETASAKELPRMAHSVIPHFANDAGSEKITIGVKEFQCMGARAPFDHPHVFLDMGGDEQIICSTLYRYDKRLAATESEPADAIVNAGEETGH
jgi:uncharacterized Zn-finger protein